MKTVSLYNYIASELYYLDNPAYLSKDKNYINYFNNNYMKKIQKFTPEVQKIVDENIFLFNALPDESSDLHFKKMFIHHFLGREIAFQSVELFSTKVASTFLTNYQVLDNYYTNLNSMLENNTENTTDSNGGTSNNQRSIISTVPQNRINLDLNNDTMDYADTNTIQKNTTENKGSNKSKSKSYKLDDLVKLQDASILVNILNEFDKKCFLQVW